jgi:hypothetical protein
LEASKRNDAMISTGIYQNRDRAIHIPTTPPERKRLPFTARG